MYLLAYVVVCLCMSSVLCLRVFVPLDGVGLGSKLVPLKDQSATAHRGNVSNCVKLSLRVYYFFSFFSSLFHFLSLLPRCLLFVVVVACT